LRASGNDCLAINVFHNHCGDESETRFIVLGGFDGYVFVYAGDAEKADALGEIATSVINNLTNPSTFGILG